MMDRDAGGRLTANLQEDMMEKAKLPALGYRNLREALGENFHASPALLKTLNPQAKFASGEEIRVPNVADAVPPVAPPRGGRQAAPNNPATTTVTAHNSTSDHTVTAAAEHILFYAPVPTAREPQPH